MTIFPSASPRKCTSSKNLSWTPVGSALLWIDGLEAVAFCCCERPDDVSMQELVVVWNEETDVLFDRNDFEIDAEKTGDWP